MPDCKSSPTHKTGTMNGKVAHIHAASATFGHRDQEASTWVHSSHGPWVPNHASETYRRAFDATGLKGSMSAVGNPYHNAQAECFMKTSKVEDVYPAGYAIFSDVS